MNEGTLRFNEIRKRVPSITQRMLTNHAFATASLRRMDMTGTISAPLYLLRG
ncbi:winged helix-turn-helix transcriptional regulator, partial [Klebsiella pneumoniae]